MPNHIVTEKLNINEAAAKLRPVNIHPYYGAVTKAELERWNTTRAAIATKAKEAQERRATIADAFLAGELENPLSQAQLAADEILLLAVELLQHSKARASLDPMIQASLVTEQARAQDELAKAKSTLTKGLADLGITGEMAVASATMQDSTVSALTEKSNGLHRSVSKRAGSISQVEVDLTKGLEEQIRAAIA